MDTYHSNARAKTIATVSTIVAIVGIVVLIEALQHTGHTASVTATPATSASGNSTAPVASNDSSAPDTSGATDNSSTTYKDGTYTADAEYYVPHGFEDIKVTLTVANGVITNSSIVNSENDRDSASYQQVFASQYKSKVVGKSLSSLKLGYVAGASDTTQAFNDAVARIQSEAKA